MLDFYVKTRIKFSLRDKRFFEKTEVEITRVDCTYNKSGSSCHNLKGELTYGKFMILDELTYDMVQLVLQYGVNRLRPTF